MGLKDRISSGMSKHSALEIFAVVVASVIVASISLYLIVSYFGIAISFSLGDILLVYVPCILTIALGGGIMGYAKTRGKASFLYIGLGMVIVALAFIVIQTLELIYYGVIL